jgi:hypothetical protein
MRREYIFITLAVGKSTLCPLEANSAAIPLKAFAWV